MRHNFGEGDKMRHNFGEGDETQNNVVDKLIFIVSILALIWIFIIDPLTTHYISNKEINGEKPVSMPKPKPIIVSPKPIIVSMPKPKPINRSIKDKIDTIAKVIYCEDNRTEKGMKLVLSVIHNRATDKNIEGLYREVKKPYQFECYSKIKKRNYIVKDPYMFKKAKKLVIEYYNGLFIPIIDAKYFFNPILVEEIPKWSLNKKLIYIYNDHWFFI